jgi:isopropylmalate/homocitrate/citramalate synthase
MKNIYPKCAKTFREWYKSTPQYNKLFNKLGNPKPFDVSLRDGIQALTKKEQEEFTLRDKVNLYYRIQSKYEPENIEIGSIVSEKVLPVFKDTLDLLYTVANSTNKSSIRPNNFILIPNKEKLKNIVNNINIQHISLITSVSNSFQIRNTKMSLEQSDKQLMEILYELDQSPYRKYPPFIKLYVSCVNECPIEGKIDIDFIVNRLLNLHKMNVNKLCISDTCGTLELDDFEYIIDACKLFGIPMSQLSLHLHVKPEREKIVEQIIHMALDKNITDFDVSLLETGGCSVTMDKNKIAPNLSYELYYQALCKYIIKRTDI